jgi:chromosome segregation ATPase
VSRRKTVFPGAEGLNGGNGFPAIKSNTAVGRILGGDFLERMRRNERQIKKERNDVDVEVLLRGAEKLCNVYPVPGVMERINDMRRRHQSLASSIAQLEEQIEEQSAQLSGMNRSWDEDGDHYQYEQQYKDEETETSTGTGSRRFSVKDFEKEESEMKALERKRRGLEDRVSGMDKDLGGLMR